LAGERLGYCEEAVGQLVCCLFERLVKLSKVLCLECFGVDGPDPICIQADLGYLVGYIYNELQLGVHRASSVKVGILKQKDRHQERAATNGHQQIEHLNATAILYFFSHFNELA
jgi:hypothetical protein